MSNCAAPDLGSVQSHARICPVDGWRKLTDDRPLVCQPCEDRMDRQLDRLARVALLLPVVARTEPTAAGGLHLPPVDLTLPGWIRHPRGDRGDQVGITPIATALAPWVAAWHEAGAGDRWRIDFGSAREVIGWLAALLPWACARFAPIAVFAEALRSTYADARRALGRVTQPVRYAAPCRACGANALLRYPGHWIECTKRLEGCGRLWDFEDVAEDMTALHRTSWAWQRSFVDPWEPMTTGQAAGYAGVAIGTIWAWVSRGRLSPIRPVAADQSGRMTPRYWPLEVDRCAAVLESRERLRTLRRVRKLVAA